MSLMYLARFIRPDILFPVNYLANPLITDFGKALRIVKFIAGVKDRGSIFDSRVETPLHIPYLHQHSVPLRPNPNPHPNPHSSS
jgi:hypothetical protein